MTALATSDQPALLGGAPRFPQGLPLVRPALGDTSALCDDYSRIIDSGILTNGRTVRRLEEAVADRIGVPHVVSVSSCTAGLALVYQALEAHGGVVLPSFTFSASAHAVVWAGGSPGFADVDEDTLTLDPVDADRAISEHDGPVSALSATHVYGTPCDIDALQKVADNHGIPLVYDAAHALGSCRGATPVGNFGTAEVFSLSPTKVVVGGEGGLVATKDGDLAHTLRLARDYGNPGDYNCLFAGLNARMSELHAATALHSLARLDQHLARRKELVNAFWREVDGVAGLRGPRKKPGDVSTYKDLTVVVDEGVCGLTAVEIGRALKSEGIDSRRYYHPPIHRQQAYRHLPLVDLPVTDRLAESVLSPPLWSDMTDEDVCAVAEAFRRALAAPEAVREALAAAERMS